MSHFSSPINRNALLKPAPQPERSAYADISFEQSQAQERINTVAAAVVNLQLQIIEPHLAPVHPISQGFSETAGQFIAQSMVEPGDHQDQEDEDEYPQAA